MAYISFQPRDYFKTLLYTGTGASNAQTFPETTAMQPDLVWIKNRDTTDFHNWYDAIRGSTKYLKIDGSAEVTNAESLKSFDSDGFTVGTMAECNTNTEDYVSWNWQANGAGSANEDGITASTVSVDTARGFSIVKWTGTGSTTTVGHGLGAIPDMFICKCTTTTDTWGTYAKSIGNTAAIWISSNGAPYAHAAYFNNTSPTADVFTVNSDGSTNASSTMMAYCFTSIKGYSKFGSYVGTGSASNGPFIYTGFRPAWLMIKKTSGTGDWVIFDSERSPSNVTKKTLLADTTAIEGNVSDIDMLSNGFKLQYTDSDTNTNDGDYLFMAFAEFPLVSSNDVPTVAR